MTHPSPEDLLLWRSGELDEAAASEIPQHLRDCDACRSKVERADAVLGSLANARTLLRRRGEKHRRRRIAAIGTIVTAITVLLAGTLMTLTPSAKAEALLVKAAKQESRASRRNRTLRLTRGQQDCKIRVDPAGAMLTMVGSSHDFCQAAAARFRAVGWGSDLLSARNFQLWRAALEEKIDTVHTWGDTTEITTIAKVELRRATFRFRTTDYQPLSGHFEFAPNASGEGLRYDVTESTEQPGAFAETAASPTILPPPSERLSTPAVNPQDEAEARVRLAMHETGLDRDVLVALERDGGSLKIWGTVANSEVREQLAANIDGIDGVKMAITSGTEQENRAQMLPWTTFQGDGPPLAYEAINGQFPNDPQARQQFVNTLDAATRRIAGAARSRDAILMLERRAPSITHIDALKKAAVDLERAMASDLHIVATDLQFLTGPITAHSRRMTFAQAVDLYTTVHELIFLSRQDSLLTPDAAIESVRRLLQ